MAQFRAKVRGRRGEVSRLGSKSSGLQAEVNGWNAGVQVIAVHRNGRDEFEVYETGGSNSRTDRRLLAVVKENPGGAV